VRQGNTFAHFFRRFSASKEPRYCAKIERQQRSVKIEERFDEMAKGTFGERLKRERELREVTVKEIASATRIAPKFLEALENEDWHKLPGGVFGRGFVRSIARYLGLSEENLLSDYDLARGETSIPGAKKPEERIPSPPKWIPALTAVLVIAALVGMVFGGRYAWRQYVAHRNAKKASAVVSLPSSNAARNPLVNSSPAAPASASEKSLPLELSVAASAATRVKVAADSLAVYDAELPATQNLRFSANDKFEVTAADFSVVLLELNGQKVMPALAPGSSSTISLTSKDLRQAAVGSTKP
jgi:cytoskeletal protein RodZ